MAVWRSLASSDPSYKYLVDRWVKIVEVTENNIILT
jgi:hypothetical protein